MKQAGNAATSTDAAPHVQPQEPREVSFHADLPAPTHGEQGPKAKKPRSRGRITTVIEVAAGTALAFLIELVQLRRRRK